MDAERVTGFVTPFDRCERLAGSGTQRVPHPLAVWGPAGTARQSPILAAGHRVAVDLPAFDHSDWIARYEERDDVFHLDWSSVAPADPAELSVDPPDLSAEMPHSIHGDEGLRARLADRYGVDADQVLLTLGATEALHVAVLAAVEAGDRVAVERPAYLPLRFFPALHGADVVRFERRFEEDFSFPLEQALGALDDGCRLVVLANLHNPTGAGVAEADLEELCRAADEAGAVVLVDEVFRRSAFGKTAGPACGHPAGVTVDSLTKFFGYGPLRLGWLVGPPGLIARARHAKDLLNLPVTPQGQAVAAWVLDHEAELTRHAKGRIDENRALVEAWVAEHADRVDWVAPHNGNIAAPRLLAADGADEGRGRPGAPVDDVAFATRAVEKAAVSVVPGSTLELPGHVRIGWGVGGDEVAEGLKRLSSVLG